MAEGFGIHFATSSSWSTIGCVLGLSPHLTEWQIPEGIGHPITIRQGNVADGYSEEQLREIERCLGGKATLTLSVELRRSRQVQAVEFARKVLLQLSLSHTYLIDDGFWDPFEASLWSSDEVRQGARRDGCQVLGIYE